jgi:hypothetical protein
MPIVTAKMGSPILFGRAGGLVSYVKVYLVFGGKGCSGGRLLEGSRIGIEAG